jgi:hypothetical protein
MDELERILWTYRRRLCSRADAIEALWKVDPVFRAYRPPEAWLD